MALTDIKVRSAKPQEKEYTLADGDGMFLLIHSNGSKYWRFRFRFGGKQHLMAFGVYPETSLADARQKREEARKLVAAGIDPREHKRAVKEEQTLTRWVLIFAPLSVNAIRSSARRCYELTIINVRFAASICATTTPL
ncbi:integrase [Salmonella enterica subsp. enterica serovar Norwich str. CFSAN001077]|nr:integrase [Salmonella enterica subsp. enterica serovar Norwich str. CFSAN001077]